MIISYSATEMIVIGHYKMKKSLSLIEIGILVLGIIAISYALGSSVGEVSAGTSASEEKEKQPPAAAVGLVANQVLKIFSSKGDPYKYRIVDGIWETSGGPNNIGWTQVNKEASEILWEKYGERTGIPEAIFEDDEVDIPIDEETKTAGEGKIITNSKFGLGTIVKNAAFALGVYGAVKMVGSFLDLEGKQLDVVSAAVASGFFLGKTSYNLFSEKGNLGLGKVGDFLGTKWGGFAIGAGVAVAVILLTYKDSKEIKTQYNCEPWDAPTGGKECEKCNEGDLPCTEYQCRSLGQACELINKGTGEEKCVWVNERDVEPPVINAWEDALLNEDWTYSPDDAVSPPERGVYIEYNGGCIPAFTPFNFGIISDEPSKCKIDTTRKETFEEMNLYFGGSSTLKYNHTQTMSFPGPDSLESENITLQNNGNFELYVRCQDANGNPSGESPSSSFVFKYCVDEGPDTTPPLIVDTSFETGNPIAYDQSELNLEIYLNEPAECKWSHDKDMSFGEMNEKFVCSSSIFEMNAQMLYKCSTTLTGLEDEQENKFFFRCKDKPLAISDRNENSEGYEFIVIGTQPMVINSAEPNETTVKGGGDTIKVTLEIETSAGYDEGNSTCYYSESCYKEKGSKTDYTAFYYKEGISSYYHEQDLWIAEGNYECLIKCVDLGGNSDEVEIIYDVETDTLAPEITRIYHEDNNLKIVTNEEAECVYSTDDCNFLFEDGYEFKSLDDKTHFVLWNSEKKYYIKCKDEYSNQPYPDSCSIIVRPSIEY